MTTVLLDTHVLHWYADEPERLTEHEGRDIREATEVAVAALTWYELAWLHRRGRIKARIPLRAWLDELSKLVRTVPLTAAIAARAAELPAEFPRDPADRVIFATAVEHGYRLVTRDRHIRDHDSAGDVVVR